MSPARTVRAVLLVAGCLYAGSWILATSGEPDAPAGSGTTPTEVLAVSPLDGRSFAELARAETDPARRVELHRIAARRAPRDLEVRAWLFEHHLAAGEPASALAHLDVLLRLAPAEMRKALLPAVLQLSADPAFAEALVAVLASEPNWRRAVLDAMRGEPNAPGATLVFAELRERDALSDPEAGRWLDALMAAGHWGQAYSLWVSGLDRAAGEPLPMLWDGGFDREPTRHGFGWRIGTAPGSYVQLEEAAGTPGRAARMVFLGRAVARGNLEQPMHLPPGAYRIRMRLKAEALRSDQGLAWEVACASGRPRFTGAPIGGSFEWRDYTVAFDVPVTGCSGQWLRLGNPAPAGSARLVSGELWVDDVTLEPAAKAS